MQVGTKPFHKGISTEKDIADAGCDAGAGGDASIMAKVAIPGCAVCLRPLRNLANSRPTCDLTHREKTDKKSVFGAL